jgi:two-component system, cell cycle sensor histidine kinase and response regulator CckA
MPRVALLVDDEQKLRAFVSAVLREGGFHVLEAADGKDALLIVQRVNGIVDVLVTDIGMPHMTGIELVTKVKCDFPGIPVVYISGDAGSEGLHNPSARTVFLQKPFGAKAILDAIRTVIAPAAAATQAW